MAHSFANNKTYVENKEAGDGNGDKIKLKDLKDSPPNHPDYKPPKDGDKKVNHPRGKGWIDNKGRVWIPDDHRGTHAPHWDVQPKKGPGYETKYPIKAIAKGITWGAIGAGTVYILMEYGWILLLL